MRVQVNIRKCLQKRSPGKARLIGPVLIHHWANLLLQFIDIRSLRQKCVSVNAKKSTPLIGIEADHLPCHVCVGCKEIKAQMRV